MIPIDKMIEIFDDCVELGVQAVELTGGGEPSLHPYFYEMLWEIRERNLDIGLITNGAWRDKDFYNAITILKDAEWVRFSIDAATQETHQITHASKSNDFQRAIAAMQALKPFDVTVGYSFIVQKQNMHEIEQAVDLASHIGVDYIRIGCVMFDGERVDHIELSPEEHAQTVELVNQLKKRTDVDVWDNFTTRPCMDYPRYNEGDTCYYSYLGTTIGADMRLYPCCIWKYRPDGVIADLNEVRFAEVWKSGILDKFYEKFDISQKCDRCFLKDKNDFLTLLIDEEPRHINFV